MCSRRCSPRWPGWSGPSTAAASAIGPSGVNESWTSDQSGSSALLDLRPLIGCSHRRISIMAARWRPSRSEPDPGERRLPGSPARFLPRDAPHPPLRGEGRGALPRRRAARVPPCRDRPGGRRDRRLRSARGGGRDRLDASRARPRDREGHCGRSGSWPSCTARSKAAAAATAARCTSTTSRSATSARTRSWAAACRASSGAALAFQMRGEKRVAVAFFGDGATNIGHVPRVAEPRAALEGARGLRPREQRLGRVDAGEPAASAACRRARQARGGVRDEAHRGRTARTSRPSTSRRSRRASTRSPARARAPAPPNAPAHRALRRRSAGLSRQGRAAGGARDEGSDPAARRAPRALRTTSSRRIDAEVTCRGRGRRRVREGRDRPGSPRTRSSTSMPELTYREAVRDALGKALREDDGVFIMGEDIAEMGGSMARHPGPARRVRARSASATRRSRRWRSSAAGSAPRSRACARSSRSCTRTSSRSRWSSS